MDTKEKYGLEKKTAVLLFVQIFLVLIGLLAQIGLIVYVCVYVPEWTVIASSVCMVLTYISIIVYATIGFKKNKLFYIIAIGLFLLSLLLNSTISFRDEIQKVLLMLLFGTFSAFIFKLDNFKVSNILAVVGVCVALGFSIYSSCYADVNSFVGSTPNRVIAGLCMHYSIFSPVVVAGLLTLTNNVRNTRNK